jgi:chemotaxis protein MotB
MKPIRPVLTLLVSVTALTGCGVSKSEYEALQTKNRGLEQQNQDLQQQVSRLQGAIKFVVNSDLLFAPGSWQMSPEGQEIIAKMATQLEPTQRNKIVVNGYTDDAPVSARLRKEGVTSNQVLSERRAQSVMEFLTSRGVKPELVMARGFGDASPVAPNTTSQGRAQNRRVELTLSGSGN